MNKEEREGSISKERMERGRNGRRKEKRMEIKECRIRKDGIG